MKKDEFLKRLEYLLSDLPEEEKRDAIEYYGDYLEEAGPEREAEVLQEFGSPERIAAMIRTNLLDGMKDAGEYSERGYADHRFDETRMGKKYPSVPARSEKREEGWNRGMRQDTVQPEEKRKKSWWFWLLILLGAVILAPVVFSLFFDSVGILLGLIFSFIGIFFGLALLTLAAVIAGGASLFFGAVQLFGSFWSGLLFIGLGIAGIGIGVLLAFCCYLFYGRFLPWLVKKAWKFVNKTLLQKDAA